MKRFVLCIIAVLMAISTGALFASGSSETITTLAFPESVSSVPFMELVERYPDDYAGESFTDHPQALARLINGETQVLATGFTVGLQRNISASDLRLAFVPVWGVSSLVTSTPVSSWEELAGMNLYIPFAGSPIDTQMKASLAGADITDSVTIEYAPFPQSAALLIQGMADAAVLPEPLASKLVAAGKAYRFITLQEAYSQISGGEERSPQVAVFTLRSYADGQRRDLAKLNRRLETIIGEIAADPEYYAAKYAERFDLPQAVLSEAFAHTLLSISDAGEERELVETYLELMNLPSPDDGFFR